MNLPRPTMRSLWRRPARPVAAAVAVVDPADMGTCFGLELSLGLPAAAAEPAAAGRVDSGPWWERAGVRKSCGA